MRFYDNYVLPDACKSQLYFRISEKKSEKSILFFCKKQETKNLANDKMTNLLNNMISFLTYKSCRVSTDWNQPDLWPPTAKIQPIPTQPSSAAWVPAKIQGLSINAPRRPATTRATRACQHQSLTSITTLRKLISRSCCFAWFLHKRGLRASGAKKPSHTWFPAESELRPAAISSATRLHHQTTAHGSLSSLHKQTPSISPRRRPFWPHRRWRCRCRGLAVARPVNVCPKVEKHYGAETNGCCPTVAAARKTATRRSPPTLFLYVL